MVPKFTPNKNSSINPFRVVFLSDIASPLLPSGRKKPSDCEIQMMELVRFFCEVKVHDHAHYFVDSLWEHCEVLQDWTAITGLLLDHKTSFTLGDEETRAVLEILVCAVHRASGAMPPSGRARNKV